MNTGLVPAVALPWIRVVIVGLGFAVATTGLYDIGKKVLVGIQDYANSILNFPTVELGIQEFTACRGSPLPPVDETIDR